MYTRNGNEVLVGSAVRFLKSCILGSPQKSFAHLVERKRIEEDRTLRECFVVSLEEFAQDLMRWKWRFDTANELFQRLLLAPNLQAVYFYRLSHALFLREVKLVPDVIAALARWMTGVEIYYSAKIGPGLKVIHGLGTVIGAETRIGSHFTVYQGVTVGDKLGKATGLDQRPEIGDYVIACAGSAILGPVGIGERVIIGVNSVVLDSLPSRCIAVGSPAVVKTENLSDEGFEDFWTAIRG
jgi:serine O-acetyltransferase